jgi:hypothetical protein
MQQRVSYATVLVLRRPHSPLFVLTHQEHASLDTHVRHSLPNDSETDRSLG